MSCFHAPHELWVYRLGRFYVAVFLIYIEDFQSSVIILIQ